MIAVLMFVKIIVGCTLLVAASFAIIIVSFRQVLRAIKGSWI